MADRNTLVTMHYNGFVFIDENISFSFNETDTVMFKLHRSSDIRHLKDRIEKKVNRLVQDITYRQPLPNGVDGGVFYVMMQIDTDNTVKSMFQCHYTMPQLKTIEIYVRLEDEAYPTQSSYSHQYEVSQINDEEITQNNEPFIRNEEVGEYSDDELDDIHFEDLFGDDDDEGHDELMQS
ncbi:unnamed protein product [Lathyrus sativus]|nr:unnamed protein product [Lathyrus sativus]